MSPLRPLPTAAPAPDERAAKALDLDLCVPLLPQSERDQDPRTHALGREKPMLPLVFRDPDDPFEEEFGRSIRAELDHGDRGHLPTLIPLEWDYLQVAKHPWAVNSLTDLFRVYLAELSISAGAVVLCGVLAGQIAHHFIHSVGVASMVAIYVLLFLIYTSSIYLGARAKQYQECKREFRLMLLTCLVMTIPHLAASAILKAAG